MNKYRNKPTIVDGIRFASKAEAARYEELKLLQKAGMIRWFIRQPRFDLGNGIIYVADFLVASLDVIGDPDDPESASKIVIEDVKGHENSVFKLKRKLFEAQYQPLTIIKGRK